VEKIDLTDVISVSEKYFKPENWYLSLCGDMSKEDFQVNY
jgi:predicted Zn-dependent peptidase